MATSGWDARCKSGFTFERRNGKHTPCNAVCRRGELICQDCSTAQVTGLYGVAAIRARFQHGMVVAGAMVLSLHREDLVAASYGRGSRR